MAEKTTQTIYIEADPDTVMAVIADIGAYPEWVSEYTETEVLETDTALKDLKKRVEGFEG